MLEVRTLSVRYGSTAAVVDADLDIAAGEALALLGANGAGKTSTLRAISGLVPKSGQVFFDGQEITGLPPEKVARLGIIHVPEGRRVFPTLTVHDNLLVGATARSGRKTIFDVSDVYEIFPALQPLRQRLGWALSGGEQQMVAIGRALMSAPRLLMLDEPSLGLAPIVVKAVYEAVAQVKSQMPILLVEQNAAVALGLCDRGAVMLSGQVVLRGLASELSDRTALMDSYLGHVGGEEPSSSDQLDGPGTDAGTVRSGGRGVRR